MDGDKLWIHGTKEYLRPDTMWADERYSKITQAEINEAKKKYNERLERQKGHPHESHKVQEPAYKPHIKGENDHVHIVYKTEKPLYPW